MVLWSTVGGGLLRYVRYASVGSEAFGFFRQPARTLIPRKFRRRAASGRASSRAGPVDTPEPAETQSEASSALTARPATCTNPSTRCSTRSASTGWRA